MKKFIAPVLLIFLLAFSVSCDKVDPPYKKPVVTTTTDTTNTDSTSYERKVLIEDYTGHKCGNCPGAAIELENILTTHSEKVIAMSVHAGFFAKPSAGNYSTDFRTPAGDALDNFFGISNAGNPNGMVDRVGYNTSHIKAYTTWSAMVTDRLSLPPEAHIEIANNFNSSTGGLTSTIKTKFLKAFNDSFNLAVYLIQDSIVDYQADYSQPAGSQDVANYVHRHVLRGSMNGNFGEVVAAGSIAKDAEFTKTYSYTIPAAWVNDKVYVMAYVFRKSNYEIIQAEEKKIIKP